MKRGSVVTVAMPGSYGKPRPAVVIQSDLFSDLGSVVVLPITSHLMNAPLVRINVKATSSTGLDKHSQVMIDKPHTVPQAKIGSLIGHLDDSTMLEINRSLMVVLGIA